MKRSIQALLLASVIAGTTMTTTPAFASDKGFSDISQSYAKTQIQTLHDAGILNGYENGSFGPTRPMTREEFAVVLVKALGLQPDANASTQFSDVDSWAKPYVGALVKSGLTNGVSPHAFGARELVTREQLAMFLVKALGQNQQAMSLNLTPEFADRANVDSWAAPSVAYAKKIGLIQGFDRGDGTFNYAPRDNSDRQAVAVLVYKIYTNRDAYTKRSADIATIDSILQQSATAMSSAKSLTESFQINAPGGGTNETINYTATPFTVHVKGTEVYDNPDPAKAVHLPVEYYVVGGKTYRLNYFAQQWSVSDGEAYQAFQPDMQRIAPLATDLSMTDNGTSFTLTGTLDQTAYQTVYAHSSPLMYSIEAPSYGFTINIDKATMHETGETITFHTNAGDRSLVVSYSNFDQLQPAVVPSDVLVTAQHR